MAATQHSCCTQRRTQSSCRSGRSTAATQHSWCTQFQAGTSSAFGGRIFSIISSANLWGPLPYQLACLSWATNFLPGLVRRGHLIGVLSGNFLENLTRQLVGPTFLAVGLSQFGNKLSVRPSSKGALQQQTGHFPIGLLVSVRQQTFCPA